jgi:hypothetical protein
MTQDFDRWMAKATTPASEACPPTFFVVYACAKRSHWPDRDDDGYCRSDNCELAVHVDVSPEACREAMNNYFTEKKNAGDYRMTCWFAPDSMHSTPSGNYNGGGYMSAVHTYEIRRAPRIGGGRT